MFYQMNVTLNTYSLADGAPVFGDDPTERICFFPGSHRRQLPDRYALAIALRYIPDIQRDYRHIAFAQQTRGLDLSRKEKLGTRIKNAISMVWPLILSSLDRIEKISAAIIARFRKPKKANVLQFAAACDR